MLYLIVFKPSRKALLYVYVWGEIWPDITIRRVGMEAWREKDSRERVTKEGR